MVGGGDFNGADGKTNEQVVIISQSIAQRMFADREAVNRHLIWTDPVMKFADISTTPRRIIGVAADVDDENVERGPSMTVYHPFSQRHFWAVNLLLHTHGNHYSLVSP